MTTVYLSLGSNKGKREHFLRDALEMLGAHPAITITQVSPIYETEPWPQCHSHVNGNLASDSRLRGNDMGWFLNQVVALQTSLAPERLLALCQSVEKKVGRLPSEKWGPREIDVDILLYGDQVLDLPGLRVPHPHMHERRFILAPLLEVAPSLCDPASGKPYKTLLQTLTDSSQVKPYFG